MSVELFIKQKKTFLEDRMRNSLLTIIDEASRIDPDKPYSWNQLFKLKTALDTWYGLDDTLGFVEELDLWIRREKGKKERRNE
jgi:hypothetical protein